MNHYHNLVIMTNLDYFYNSNTVHFHVFNQWYFANTVLRLMNYTTVPAGFVGFINLN